MSNGSTAGGRLTSRLGAELGQAPNACRSGLHMAAFRALREEIAEALEDGYTVMAAWKMLQKEGKIRMVYETFRRYCHSAELGRQPLSAGRKGPSKASGMPLDDGMPPQTFKHDPALDEKQLY